MLPSPSPNFGLTEKKRERAKKSPWGIANVVSNSSIKSFLLLPMFVADIFVFFENTETCRRNGQHNPCFDINDTFLAIPKENINLTLHRLGTNGRFSVNISWILPPGKFELLVSSSSSSSLLFFTRNTCIAELREARGEGHKMSEMKEGRELEKVVLLGRAGFNAGSNIGG